MGITEKYQTTDFAMAVTEVTADPRFFRLLTCFRPPKSTWVGDDRFCSACATQAGERLCIDVLLTGLNVRRHCLNKKAPTVDDSMVLRRNRTESEVCVCTGISDAGGLWGGGVCMYFISYLH